MGYQQNNGNKKFNNNNRGGYKPQNDRPRNKIISFPLVMSGTTSNDRTYDVNDALASLETLKDNNTFSMLSVPVHISRALLENNPERRGTTSVGFIRTVNISDLTVDVTIYGNQVETIEGLSLNLVPRMLVKDERVMTFLGFDLVEA